MSEKSYAELLRDPRWQRKRLEILNRDGWRCRHCNDEKSELQVHHKRYERGRLPWEYEDHVLVALCKRCHERTTELRKRLNDVASEMTTTDLVLAVESLWATRSVGPAKPLQAVLEYCEREKGVLIANRYCQKASRRVDALDHLIECVWDVLQSGSATVEG